MQFSTEDLTLDLINKSYDLEGFKKPRMKGTYHPSSASAIIEGKLYGACHRATWYKLQHDRGRIEETNPMTYSIKQKANMGNRTHDMFTEELKGIRAYYDDEVEFYDPATRISGRVDNFSINPRTDELIGWEIKSIDDFNVKWIKLKGAKMEAILQVLIYMHIFRDECKDWRILYISRGTSERFCYSLYLDKDDNPIVNGEKIKVTFDHLAERYKELGAKLSQSEAPDREFELVWDKERLRKEATLGNLTKTEMDKMKKGHSVKKGDWACSFCNNKDRCWELNDYAK